MLLIPARLVFRKLEYHHSYCVFLWSGVWDSNPQPDAWKAPALPIELTPLISRLVAGVGFEPTYLTL